MAVHAIKSGTVWKHVDLLPDRYRIVIETVYLAREGLAAAAKLLGVCESRASQLHTAALAMLKASIETAPPRAGPEPRKCPPYGQRP